MEEMTEMKEMKEFTEMRENQGVVGLTKEEVDQIKEAFNLFGNDSGEIDLDEFKQAIKSLKLHSKYPVINKLILNLGDKKRKNNLLTFDEFIQEVGEKLGDKKSRDGIRKIFDLFNNKPGKDTIKTKDLIKKCGELGINLSEKVFNFILNNIKDENKETLTFEEFYKIMTNYF